MTVLKELWVPALVVAYGALYYADTRGLPEQSTLFPSFLMVAMPILGALVLLDEARKARARPDAPGSGAGDGGLAALRRPALVFGFALGYLALFASAGFLVASPAFLLASMLALRVRWPKALAVAVAFTGVLYLVFAEGFGVRL